MRRAIAEGDSLCFSLADTQFSIQSIIFYEGQKENWARAPRR